MEAYRLGPKAGPVYEELRRRILAGEYPFGSRLPPHQQLAADFGIASLTMRQALAYLEREGLVSREPGRGTFVRDRRTNPGRRSAADRTRQEGMPAAVLVFGPDGEITAATPATYDILRLQPEDVVGVALSDSVIQELEQDRDRFQADIFPVALALMSKRTVRDVVVRLRTSPEDEWLWLNVNAYPQITPDGAVSHVICTLENIKEEGAAEHISPDEVVRAVLQASPLPSAAFDREGRTTIWNPAAAAIFGFSEDDMHVTPPPLIPPGREPEFYDLVRRVLNGETVQGLDTQRWTKDGTVLDVRLAASPLRLVGGAITGGVIILTDITEHKRTEQALESAVQRLHGVVENANDLIFTIDLQGNFTSFNRAAEQVSGYHFGEDLDLNIAQILPPESINLARGMIAQKLRDHRPTRYEIDVLSRDGRRVPLELNTQIILDNGVPVGVQGIARDITARRSYEERLLHQAMHDSLTDMPNRDNLQEQTTMAIERLRGTGGLALLLIDLDHFRDLNDTYGHEYGDNLLRQLGHRLQDILGGDGQVARLGGDEFAVLLCPASRAEAQEVAERVLTSLDEPFEIGEQAIIVHPSIGIALFPEHGDNVTALMRRADVAMYRAKQDREGLAFYAPDRDHNTPDRLQLTTDLRHAIRNQQLRLYYQPQVNLHSGTIGTVEALLRWQHPERGLILPSEFLSTAEHAGLLKPITYWVLDEALRQRRAWRDEGIDIRVSINIPTYLLHDPALLRTIADQLKALNLTADDLVLEITEDALLYRTGDAIIALASLHQMGVHIALDDFGAGFSSLGYLNRLSVNELKIDRSFITRISPREQDTAIVRSIIDLAHNLNLQVIAEGVEDVTTLDALTGMGCDVVQGFYFSQPMAPAELGPWLRQHLPTQ